MTELDDTGTMFGSTRMNFETLDSEGPHGKSRPESSIQVAQEHQEQTSSHVNGKTYRDDDRRHNNVQGRAFGFSDLLRVAQRQLADVRPGVARNVDIAKESI